MGEYSKEVYLGFEKEVLGVYISGHPLEEYEEKWQKNITRPTMDFQLEEESGQTRVKEGELATVGGMIVDKTIKYTRNNQAMAFITLEDLVGTLEIVIFPNSYEKNSRLLNVDEKVFVRGRVQTEDEKNAKLICERIYSFDDTRKELWLQFSTREEYGLQEAHILELLKESDGKDSVIIYISSEKQMKRLPPGRSISVRPELVSKLKEQLGENNVKVVEKSIEKL